MAKKTAHEILIGAINAIEKYGWIQGHGGSRGLGYCIVGAFGEALRSAEGGARTMQPPVDAFVKVMNDSPIHFNDAEGRTKEEVLEALRKAAASCAPEPDTEFLNEDSSRSVDRGSDTREATLTRA